MPDASVVLDLDMLTEPADYFAGLFIGVVEQKQRHPLFSGSVISARAEDRKIHVEARGAAAIAETLIGGMATRGIPAMELVYTLARGAGFREEQMNIEGIERLPRETFEVLVPIEGLALTAPTEFAGVRFQPAPIVDRLNKTLSADDVMWSKFDAPTYALVLVTESRCLHAEEKALAAIDLALAWMNVSLRYGLAVLPDGISIAFQRSQSLASPKRGELVFLRGLTTWRQWLRAPEHLTEERSVEFADSSGRFDPDLPGLTLQERLAILALARASQERDPLARVHALFEAVEFYAAKTRLRAFFTPSECQSIQRSIPSGLTAGQRARVVEVLKGLNNLPLRIRLMAALDEDRVPLVRDADIALLWKLRELRNDVTHGRRSDQPALEDLDHATSIVARMLVFRIARRKREGQPCPEDSRAPL